MIETTLERPAPVLIVDDDTAIRESLRDVLEGEGYAVFEARNGREALRHLRAVRGCMVVLLDVNMPVMDGFDVLRVVAADMKLLRGHAFLIVTAYSHISVPPDVASIMQEHGIPFVPKPFDIEVLLETVAEADRRIHEQAEG